MQPPDATSQASKKAPVIGGRPMRPLYALAVQRGSTEGHLIFCRAQHKPHQKGLKAGRQLGRSRLEKYPHLW